ncbi:MAG: hypothetical protein OEX09_00905 [Candidatus Bathyarchaeota archaeon]|nr:hypothetical protein [Candidatus Bathyarchaeota archaeon]
MKSTNKHLGRSRQLQAKKVKREHSSEVDYHSELRDWVQHVILEAEKNKDFKKKEKFLRLLEDL